jgi:hypothetical protein
MSVVPGLAEFTQPERDQGLAQPATSTHGTGADAGAHELLEKELGAGRRLE